VIIYASLPCSQPVQMIKFLKSLMWAEMVCEISETITESCLLLFFYLEKCGDRMKTSNEYSDKRNNLENAEQQGKRIQALRWSIMTEISFQRWSQPGLLTSFFHTQPSNLTTCLPFVHASYQPHYLNFTLFDPCIL
jgi:hypothetical protein